MQLVLRIFVVLNLVLSAMFLAGAIVTHYIRVDLADRLRQEQAQEQKLRGRLDEPENGLRARQASLAEYLTSERDKLEGVRARNDAELGQLEQQLVNESTRFGNLVQENKDLGGQLQTAQDKLAELRASAVALRNELGSLRERNQELTFEQFDLRNQLAQATNYLETALARNQSLENRLSQLRKSAEGSQ